MYFFFRQKTSYEMRISDWSSDVCSSDLLEAAAARFEDAGTVGRNRECDRHAFQRGFDRVDHDFVRARDDALGQREAEREVLQVLGRRHHHREWLAVAGEGDRNLGGHHVAGLGCAAVAAVQDLLSSRAGQGIVRSEEHTSELQSLMRISYAVFCLNKKTQLI